MSKKYIDAGRGTLNRADNRNSEKSPEYYGKLEIDGTEYRLAAWVKENPKDGRKFFSIAASIEQEESAPAEQQGNALNSEDIPF